MSNTQAFPQLGGETLAWDIGHYMTIVEEREGYPRARAVARAMRHMRPEQLYRERRDMLRGSFDRLFGHNARRCLKLIEEVLAEPDTRPGFYYVTVQHSLCRNAGADHWCLRGPFVNDDAAALAAVEEAQGKICELYPRAKWYAFGTYRSETDVGRGFLDKLDQRT